MKVGDKRYTVIKYDCLDGVVYFIQFVRSDFPCKIAS